MTEAQLEGQGRRFGFMVGVDSSHGTPRLSFGMPVRNGAPFLRRVLDSVLAQDFPDFEVVVCDNASDDETEAICREYAALDSRIRYFRSKEDVGQIENFNRAFRASRGTAFRWIGADDWLEPSYARKCLAVLDANPSAIGVTTLWRFVDDEGGVQFEEYNGPRVDSPGVRARLARVLWFFQPGRNRLYFDPIYSLLRSHVLKRTGLLRVHLWTDFYLALELCLLGPFAHVHECLANRRNAKEAAKVRLRRYHTQFSTVKNRPPYYTLYLGFAAIIQRSPMHLAGKIALWLIVLVYWIRARCSGVLRRVTGAGRCRLRTRAQTR
jgi:glycosyltransferase involved in cell wall biosynthesis